MLKLVRRILHLSSLLFLVFYGWSVTASVDEYHHHNESSVSPSPHHPITLPDHVLKIGIVNNMPPYMFIDKKGKPTGFYVELTEEVLSHHDIAFEFVSADWHENIVKLKNKEIDLHPFVNDFDYYKDFLDFSDATTWVHVVVFVRDDSSITSINDLLGREKIEILVERATTWARWLEDNITGAHLIAVNSSEDVLKKLSQGKADVAVMIQGNGLYLANKYKLNNVHTTGDILLDLEGRYAVPRGDQRVIDVLNDGIHHVRSDGTYDELFDKWFGISKSNRWISKDSLKLYIALAVILLSIISALSLWSRHLKKSVIDKSHALQIKEEQLAHAARLNTLGLLSSSIAHEINQPLSSISQFNSSAKLRLEKMGIQDETLISYIDNSVEQAQRAGKIIRRIRGLVTKKRLPREMCNINILIRESSEMLKNTLIMNKVKLNLELNPKVPYILVDCIQIQQVIMNLIRNSIEAMLSTVTADPIITVITNLYNKDKDVFIVMSVQDNGPGIEPELINSIFDAYVSSSDDGLGLGLSICKTIIEAHQGTINVDSQYKNGARIEILLPIENT